MGFGNYQYAKMWRIVKRGDNYMSVSLETDRRAPDGDGFVKTFSGLVNFRYDAYEKLKGMRGNEKIFLLDVDTEQTFKKDERGYDVPDRTFYTVTDFTADMDQAKRLLDEKRQSRSSRTGGQRSGGNRSQARTNSRPPVDDGIDDPDVPF